MRITLLVGMILGGMATLHGQQDTTFPPFPSAKDIKPKVQASVVSSDTGLAYSYDISDSLGAKQAIEFFFVILNGPNLTGESHPQLWAPSWITTQGLRAFDWGARLPSATLQSGQPPKRFSITSAAPPGIVEAHAGGMIEPDTVEEPEYDMTNADIRSNSIILNTIGPQQWEANFQPLAFLDTLGAYVVRSHSLRWIPSQNTSDSYTHLFSRIETDIFTTDLVLARKRVDTVIQQANLDSTSALNSEAYALIRFNVEYLRAQLLPRPDIKGGIFVPGSFGSIIIKAMPDTSYASSDTLVSLTATIRWPSQYNVTFGTIATSYGFVKLDTAVTMGSYKYQKFRTTTHTPIAWQAGQEYELFSVPVTGACGAETFELTNALPGGEWFVDINYLDKSDTSFYQRSVQGFAYQNKTAESYGTFANGQRHLIKGGGKLHETFASAGEILYRRTSDGGSTWDLTTRISDGRGACLEPSIASGASSMLYLVWEQGGGSSASVLFARSTDNGSTWSVADTLPGCTNLTVSTSQAGWLRPVVAELPGTPAQVIIVWADQGGLKYHKSTNSGASWVSGPTAIPPTIKSTSDNPYIWYPSLSAASTYLMLTYDYRAEQPELYSRVYTASSGWSSEACVTTSTGTIFDRHSSNAIMDDGTPFAVWCAQKYVNGVLDVDYRLMFRTGTSANTWNSTFVEFPKNAGVWDLYPTASTLSGPYFGARGYRIIYQRTNSEICTYSKMAASGSWTRARLSTNGQGASATLEKGTNTGPTFLWTDLSASPYAISVGTSLGTPLPLIQSLGESQGRTTPTQTLATGEEPLVAHRKVVLEDPDNHSVVSYELAPLKLITTEGDTSELPFKTVDSVGTLTQENVWDYLGTDPLEIGQGVRSVLVDVTVSNEVSADTARGGQMKMGANSFATASKAYRLELAGSTKAAAATTLYSDNAGASKRSIVTLGPQAKGKRAAFRLVGTLPASADLAKRLVVGLGDVLYRK